MKELITNKVLLSVCLIIFFSAEVKAQSVAVNTTGANANQASLLDIDVTGLTNKKGLLIPRMTLVQRDAMTPLPSAAQGLLLYQTDGLEGFYYNTSTSIIPNWVYLSGGNNGWSLTGNAGTVDGTNFIGTLDYVPLNFIVYNQRAGRIDASGHNTFLGNLSGNANGSGGFGNTGIGSWALTSNSFGNFNTSTGATSLFYNTSGSYNTAFGFGSLDSNVAGNRGVAIGYNSQHFVNNTGANWDNTNTSIGYESLRGSSFATNNTGIDNTAVGYDALLANTSGSKNAANGFSALYSNSSGYNNTANGYQTLYRNTIGFQNTGTGYEALYSNTTGHDNTASGAQALFLNTTGNDNISIGYTSLFNNVAGNHGVAIGFQSQFNVNNKITSWDNTNTSVGFQSLMGSVIPADNTGIGNTAIGRLALFSNSAGELNTSNGYLSLYSNTVGSYNTSIGYGSLYSNISGNKNTAIGYDADVLSDNLTNATAIGYNATVATSNSLVLGGTGADAVNVGIGTTTPTSKLQVVGLPIYSNNASAIAGGLTVGAFYRSGGDPDLVCVVH
jgi:trimeric autotransporter adhesin